MHQVTPLMEHCRFAMALTGPPQEVVVVSPDAARWRARSLLSAVGHFIWEVSADLLRAVWLTILFAPLAVLAPFALQYNMRRQEWMELLRCDLYTIACLCQLK